MILYIKFEFLSFSHEPACFPPWLALLLYLLVASWHIGLKVFPYQSVYLALAKPLVVVIILVGADAIDDLEHLQGYLQVNLLSLAL